MKRNQKKKKGELLFTKKLKLVKIKKNSTLKTNSHNEKKKKKHLTKSPIKNMHINIHKSKHHKFIQHLLIDYENRYKTTNKI